MVFRTNFPALLHDAFCCSSQGDRDEAKLRRMAKAYRASRLRFGLIRYFKLKHIIHDAISELRME